MTRKILSILVCGIFLLTGAACSNTAEGFGRDLEQTGQKIQKTF